jgi:hypothetical protein
MAVTQADIDALQAAVNSGVRRVKYVDREVEYQSLDEMRTMLSTLKMELAAANGTPRYTKIATRKGFGR